MSNPNRVAIRGPVDLIALIPHLIGYQPSDGDIVVIGLHHDTIVMAGCAPIGHLSTADEQQAAVDAFTTPVSHTDIDVAAVIGYGSVETIGATIAAFHTFLTTRGILILDLLRVADGRYYTHKPTSEEDSGSADGTPFDPTTTTVAATMTFAGSVTLPDRATVVDQVAPVTGAERAHMHAATIRAWHRLHHITAPSHDRTNDRATDRATVVENAGRDAITSAYQRHRAGKRLTDDEAAWLTVLLTHSSVRDHAWSHTHGHEAHLRLWTDLTRRAEPDLVAAPATLLAFAAWRTGNGTLAATAVHRALDADPSYRMARLLAAAIFTGLPPSIVDKHFRMADDPLGAQTPADGSSAAN